jgi:peptidylprolyl isomerase
VRRVALFLLIPLLLLVGCGGNAGGNDAVPAVTGKFEEKPQVTIPKGDPPAKLQVKVLTEGSGPEVRQGDLLQVHYLGETWKGGKVFDNSYDKNAPATFPIGVDQVIPAWDKALVGKKVGSRVVLVAPPADGYGDTGTPDGTIPPKSTLVFVVDILSTIAKDAGVTGTMQPTAANLPTVKAEPGKAPQITIPAGQAASTTLVDKVLIEGSGPEVKRGQMLYAQYVGVLWNGGQEFDSSWKRGNYAGFPIGVGRVIPGWDKGLVGKKVGSRVLLVIPPADGYGDQPPQGSSIPPKSTLVFVVDILAAS